MSEAIKPEDLAAIAKAQMEAERNPNPKAEKLDPLSKPGDLCSGGIIYADGSRGGFLWIPKS